MINTEIVGKLKEKVNLFTKLIETTSSRNRSNSQRAKSREEATANAPVPIKKRRFSCFVPQKRPETLISAPKPPQCSNSLKQYKEEACKIDKIIKKRYELFFEAPETHPSYETEWFNFWEKRCVELMFGGIDPKRYDFRDEWKKFFYTRLIDLEFLEKSKTRSELFKKHMALPNDASSIAKVRLPRCRSPKTPNIKKPSSSSMSPVFKRRFAYEKPRNFREICRSRSPIRKTTFKRFDGRRDWRESPHRQFWSNSHSLENKVSIKDRLQLMGKGKYKGRKQQVSGGNTRKLY